MSWLDQFYQAAARAGMLVEARWQPSGGSAEQRAAVAFVSPAEAILDGLGVSTNAAITFPATQLAGLAARERIEVDGVAYLVRDVRAVGDGSERRATLSPI